MIMLSDEMGGAESPLAEIGGQLYGGGFFLYVEDVDAVSRQAQSAGAKVEMALATNSGAIRYGESWSILSAIPGCWPRTKRTSLPRRRRTR